VRIVIAIAFAVGTVILWGCCRPWQTSAVEPAPLNPQQYGQGGRPYSNSYDPLPPNYYEPEPYDGASQSNPYGRVTPPRPQYQY